MVTPPLDFLPTFDLGPLLTTIVPKHKICQGKELEMIDALNARASGLTLDPSKRSARKQATLDQVSPDMHSQT